MPRVVFISSLPFSPDIPLGQIRTNVGAQSLTYCPALGTEILFRSYEGLSCFSASEG